MDLLRLFQDYIKKEKLFSSNSRLLLAVSGGADSVVLAHLCKACGFNFAIAHCNFGLRAEESDADELFVQQGAAELRSQFYVKKFDTLTYANKENVSVQVAAREMRYEWFSGIMREEGFNSLLTAHHADDNVETILMNFFKGSGINGLKGILPLHQNRTRPLLFASKADLLSYAEEHQLIFREDSSNSSDKYTRNYFRNELIPGITKVFPQVIDNLKNNAARFREINEIYNRSISNYKLKLLEKRGEEVFIPVLKLQRTPAFQTILFEILKDYGFNAAQTPAVVSLLDTSPGKFVLSPSHRVLKDRKWLIISARTIAQQSIYIIEDNMNVIDFPPGQLKIDRHERPLEIDKNSLSVQLDASKIKFPLLLRKWKLADYFYPLGMQKKKKLSRFYMDQKLSLVEKENTWIVESEGRIAWIVGQRIDDRFKITPTTKRVVKLSLLSSK